MSTRAATGGKASIIDAARTLFARDGVDGTSLREVARAAGHRNTNAASYHFDGRDGLLRAVLEPHERAASTQRHAMLDTMAACGDYGVREMASALVRPAAIELETDVGRHYLRIVADLLLRDPARYFDVTEPFDAGFTRWQQLAKARMEPMSYPLHRRFSATSLCFHELGRRASEPQRPSHALFVSNLVDIVAGTLSAEISDETAALLEARDGAPLHPEPTEETE